MRALLILVLLVVGVWWVRQILQRFGQIQRQKKADTEAKPSGSRPRLPERIVACAHCGLHVPESEALRLEERFYCCEAHRQLGVSEHSGKSES